MLAAGGAGIGAGSASAGINYTMSLTLSQATVDLNNLPGAITAQARLTLSGQPQTGVQVTFSSAPTDDTFSPHPYCNTDGNGFCSVTLVPGTTVGPHTITTSFSNAVGSGSAAKTFCQYRTPTTVALSFPNGANRLAPNGGATTANILVRDANQQGVPCQSVSLTTSDTSNNKVTITTPTGGTNGNYTSTVTAPVVPLSSPPTWSGSGLPDQTLTATVSGVAPTSQTLHIAYPTLHTKQTPDPSPGLYDEFNRPVRLTGVNGVFMVNRLDDSQDTRTNGGGVYHMANPKFLPFDTAPNDTQAGVTNSSWNSSIVRFQLTDTMWCATDAACDTPGPGHPELIGTCGDQYRQNLQAMINKVTQLGMVAELSLSGVGALSQPPATALTCNSGKIDQPGPSQPGGFPMADYAYAPIFWQQLAAANANNPLVAFEFYNEPYLHDANPACATNSRQGAQTVTPGESPHAVWMNAGLPGTADENDTVKYDDNPNNVHYTFRAAGMQLMYNAVRAVAPNNLVFVNGSGEKIGDPDECNENQAYDLSPVINGYPVAGGTNVIYGSHPYYGSNCANNGSGVHDGTDSIPGLIVSGFPPNLQSAVYDTAAQYPVAFTEFGATCLVDSEAANWNQGMIANADNPAHHIVAWAAFQFMDKNMEGVAAGAAPYYLIQCTEDKPSGCSADFKTYNYYEASKRGLPVYTALHDVEPPLK